MYKNTTKLSYLTNRVVKMSKPSPPSKEDMEWLQNTLVGKLAKEIINDAGGRDQVLNKLDSYDGIGKLIGDIGLKLEAKIRSGAIDENDLMNDVSMAAEVLPGMMSKNSFVQTSTPTSTSTPTPTSTPTSTPTLLELMQSMIKQIK